MKRLILLMILSLFHVATFSQSTPIIDSFLEAQFPGGEMVMRSYIKHHIIFPSEPLARELEGDVLVFVTIEADGTIKSPYVSKGISPTFDAEALRLVKLMPKWLPAKRNGIAVQSTAIIDIEFISDWTVRQRKEYKYNSDYSFYETVTMQMSKDIIQLLKYFDDSQFKKAQEEVQKLIEQHPDYADFKAFSGLIYMLQRNYKAALEMFIKAVETGKTYGYYSESTAWCIDQLLEKFWNLVNKETLEGDPYISSLSTFPGGVWIMENFLADHLIYPKDALEKEVSGKSFVLIKTNEAGKIDSICLLNHVLPGIDSEAMRLIRIMPLWKAAQFHRKPVSSVQVVMIDFDLQTQASYRAVIADRKSKKLGLYTVTEDTPTELAEVIKLQKELKYKKADAEMDRLIQKYPGNIDILVYKGLIYLEQGKKSKACEIFFKAQDIGDSNGYTKATTREGLILLMAKFCVN